MIDPTIRIEIGRGLKHEVVVAFPEENEVILVFMKKEGYGLNWIGNEFEVETDIG